MSHHIPNMGHICHNYYIEVADINGLSKMMSKCKDCDAPVQVPSDVEDGEIISCSDCGLDYVVKNENGNIAIQELAIEGEDWGE